MKWWITTLAISNWNQILGTWTRICQDSRKLQSLDNWNKTTVVSFGRYLCFTRMSGAMRSNVLNRLTCTKESTNNSLRKAQEDAFTIKQFVIPQLQRTNFILSYNKLYSWIWEYMGFFFLYMTMLASSHRLTSHPGVGLNDPYGFLPTEDILWFCDACELCTDIENTTLVNYKESKTTAVFCQT